MATLSSEGRTRSLSTRLVLSATALCGGVLVITGIILVGLFRQHVESRFDSELKSQLVHLVSITKLAKDETIHVEGSLSGALFTEPFSGWAWQIRRGDQILMQSRSLGPALSGVMEQLEAPSARIGSFVAPGDITSRGISREVQMPGMVDPLLFAVARPQSEIDDALSAFIQAVLISLGTLGVGLVATNFFLMRMALRPLSDLRAKVACMHEGQPSDQTSWPAELQPIADELDSLQMHVDRLIERSRGQAADLAHAVKTPLSVLHQLAGRSDPAIGTALKGQLDRISAYLDRHLGRNRAAGKANLLVDVDLSISDILFALSHSLEARDIEVVKAIDQGAKFAGDEADFYELVGNLMDNASKWARSKIEITASIENNTLLLAFADDGPGVPSGQRDRIFSRGTRLDEATPGQGLGLTIVRDITRLYQGDVAIGDGKLGGAVVSLFLPGAYRPQDATTLADGQTSIERSQSTPSHIGDPRIAKAPSQLHAEK